MLEEYAAAAPGAREGCADVAVGAWGHAVWEAVFGSWSVPEWGYEAAAAWVDLGRRS